jgi:hypothetical protein
MRGIERRVGIASFLLAAIIAGAAPAVRHGGAGSVTGGDGFPGWPGAHEGRVLQELPLGEREAGFARGFPGRTARFWDGRREIVMRWVAEPTRRLHSAADCLRAVGYAIAPLPVRRDAAGRLMGCFRAHGPAGDLSVCELIRDGDGGSWPDVSAWYWHALLGIGRGPWWSIVVAERT